MSTLPNEMAFPVPPVFGDSGACLSPTELGLTKREYFASMAMQGLLAGPHKIEEGPKNDGEVIAAAAVAFADALITALND